MSMTSQRTCWPDNRHRKLRTFSHFFAQTKRALLSGASIEVDGTLTAGLALSTMIHMVAGGIWQLA